ncbi:SnoaL-like domain-containing protein [Microbacterium sp. cf046]|uniref:nuclear transport factor 2 family protein n=1 Tax=Microbacterium sp. cf046 TaxID=1761803 RepID=UPI0008F299F5|nr:nuclear transport factor 2 family protein [Microbacterium sp. cf046]SFR85815.1 SnoaL-like domain-containing protein [Microbacterium sp. cf046]
MSGSEQTPHGHIPESGESSIPELEVDENIAPRPEEEVADVARAEPSDPLWVGHDDRFMRSIPPPIAAFIDATNRGDSDAFVAAFTEDGTLDDWGRVARGHEGIREWDRTDNIGKESHFALVDIAEQAGSDTYLVHLQVTGKGFNGTSPFRFTLRDDRIASVQIVPD